MKTLVALFLCAAALAVPVRAQVAVIAHPSVADAALDADAIADLYELKKTQWPSGGAVVAFDLKSGPAKDAFYAAIGEKPGQLKKVWMRKKLSGEAQPPASVSSDSEMAQKVASTPGAIGYVDAANVPDGVKVIATF